MNDLRTHPKFLFIKKHLETYISNGGKLKNGILEKNNKRCPLGVVYLQENLKEDLIETEYQQLETKFNLSNRIAIGFDSIIASSIKIRNDYTTYEDFKIGQEIGKYCLERVGLK